MLLVVSCNSFTIFQDFFFLACLGAFFQKCKVSCEHFFSLAKVQSFRQNKSWVTNLMKSPYFKKDPSELSKSYRSHFVVWKEEGSLWSWTLHPLELCNFKFSSLQMDTKASWNASLFLNRTPKLFRFKTFQMLIELT